MTIRFSLYYDLLEARIQRPRPARNQAEKLLRNLFIELEDCYILVDNAARRADDAQVELYDLARIYPESSKDRQAIKQISARIGDARRDFWLIDQEKKAKHRTKRSPKIDARKQLIADLMQVADAVDQVKLVGGRKLPVRRIVKRAIRTLQRQGTTA